MDLTDWVNGLTNCRFYQLDEQGKIVRKAIFKKRTMIKCEGTLCELFIEKK